MRDWVVALVTRFNHWTFVHVVRYKVYTFLSSSPPLCTYTVMIFLHNHSSMSLILLAKYNVGTATFPLRSDIWWNNLIIIWESERCETISDDDGRMKTLLYFNQRDINRLWSKKETRARHMWKSSHESVNIILSPSTCAFMRQRNVWHRVLLIVQKFMLHMSSLSPKLVRSTSHRSNQYDGISLLKFFFATQH